MINIDDRLIKDVASKIGPGALSVLLVIAIHLNQKTGRCFPSHDRLMALTGMGKNAVYDALKTLKEHGLLKSEQSIDLKSGKFGNRTFRLTTRFISIFVNAQDAEPLPENRLPENRLPENRLPENREAYQINEVGQINEGEQINNLGRSVADEKNQIPLNAEPQSAPHVAAVPPNFDPEKIDDEIDAMLTDQFCPERFFRQCRKPIEQFAEYLETFRVKVKSEQQRHNSRRDFRSHFFSWATLNVAKTPASQPAAKRLITY